MKEMKDERIDRERGGWVSVCKKGRKRDDGERERERERERGMGECV